MQLGTKVLINILVVCLIAASIYGYFFIQNEREYAESQAIKRTQAFGISMKEVLEANLSSENWNHLKKQLKRISEFEEPLGMRVYLKNGELFYQSKTLKEFPNENIGELLRRLPDANPEGLVERHQFKGKELIICNFPIELEKKGIQGVLQIFESQSVVDEEVRGYQRKVFFFLMGFYGLTLAAIVFVIRKNVHQPIATLIREVQNQALVSDPLGIKSSKGSELSFLKKQFNRQASHLQELESVLNQSSLEKENLKNQLKHSEQLAAIGRFAADLAHEMGSPLSVIEGRAEQTLQKLNDSSLIEKNLQLIVGQSARLSKMIKDVLTFARKQPLHKTLIDLNRLISQATELFEGSYPNLIFEKQLASSLPKIEADPDRLLQVLINLIKNAIESMPNGGTLTLKTEVVSDEHQNSLPWVRLIVADTGQGMDEQTMIHLFEPFFSKGKKGQGTGLGLSIVYGIIEEHGGKIRVESTLDQGSRFEVFLPF